MFQQILEAFRDLILGFLPASWCPKVKEKDFANCQERSMLVTSRTKSRAFTVSRMNKVSGTCSKNLRRIQRKRGTDNKEKMGAKTQAVTKI